MATIMLNSWPLRGPVNCLLDIAYRLQQNGHCIYFIGIADCEALVAPRGFEFIPVFEQIFPKGILRQASETRDNCAGLADIYRAIVEQKQTFKHYFEFLTKEGNAEFQAIIQTVRPDLFLIEGSTETSSAWALLGYRNNLKTAYVNTILPFRKESGLPPLDSHIIPDHSLVNRLAIRLAWLRFYLLRALRHRLFDANWNKHIRRLAAAWTYPQNRIDTSPFACTLIDIPELCTTPAFLDFPAKARREVGYYLESHRDAGQDFPDPPWERIDPHKKLIYCSLGSHYVEATAKQRFYQAVLDAVKGEAGWHLILSTGDSLSAEDFPRIPANATLMKMVSQKNVLKKSDVMITHGGINSIKECIYFGVPMVVYPIKFDQPGDAARVEYHRIGIRQSFSKASAESIYRSLCQILESAEIRNNIEAMSKQYKPEHDTGLHWIENLLKREFVQAVALSSVLFSEGS